MNKEQYSSNNFKSTDLILFILERWKPLFIISFIAFIVSIFVSLSITPKYKSSIVIFPKTSDPVSKILKTETLFTEKEYLSFGEEEEVEQILQVLHSDEIRHRIIQKYNLIEHYRIDTQSKYPQTSLYSEFIGNISFKKTEYMAVQIDVLDEDPVIAANIANDIAALLDSLMNSMKQEVAKKALRIVEKEYFCLQHEIKELQDSLRIISHKEGYEILKNFITNETTRLSHLKAKYKEAKVDAENNLPYKFVLNPAYPAEKKSYPIRSLIVIISTASTFILALILLAIFDKYKSFLKK